LAVACRAEELEIADVEERINHSDCANPRGGFLDFAVQLWRLHNSCQEPQQLQQGSTVHEVLGFNIIDALRSG